MKIQAFPLVYTGLRYSDPDWLIVPGPLVGIPRLLPTARLSSQDPPGLFIYPGEAAQGLSAGLFLVFRFPLTREMLRGRPPRDENGRATSVWAGFRVPGFVIPVLGPAEWRAHLEPLLQNLSSVWAMPKRPAPFSMPPVEISLTAPFSTLAPELPGHFPPQRGESASAVGEAPQPDPMDQPSPPPRASGDFCPADERADEVGGGAVESGADEPLPNASSPEASGHEPGSATVGPRPGRRDFSAFPARVGHGGPASQLSHTFLDRFLYFGMGALAVGVGQMLLASGKQPCSAGPSPPPSGAGDGRAASGSPDGPAE